MIKGIPSRLYDYLYKPYLFDSQDELLTGSYHINNKEDFTARMENCFFRRPIKLFKSAYEETAITESSDG